MEENINEKYIFHICYSKIIHLLLNGRIDIAIKLKEISFQCHSFHLKETINNKKVTEINIINIIGYILFISMLSFILLLFFHILFIYNKTKYKEIGLRFGYSFLNIQCLHVEQMYDKLQNAYIIYNKKVKDQNKWFIDKYNQLKQNQNEIEKEREKHKIKNKKKLKQKQIRLNTNDTVDIPMDPSEINQNILNSKNNSLTNILKGNVLMKELYFKISEELKNFFLDNKQKELNNLRYICPVSLQVKIVKFTKENDKEKDEYFLKLIGNKNQFKLFHYILQIYTNQTKYKQLLTCETFYRS